MARLINWDKVLREYDKYLAKSQKQHERNMRRLWNKFDASMKRKQRHADV